MNITIVVAGQNEIAKALDAFPGKAHRACAVALTKAAKAIKADEVNEMKSVFDRPTRWTLNSLQLVPATKNDLTARVLVKDQPRMSQHYLVPQVEGGPRKLKGFERGLDNEEFVPGAGVKLNAAGNVPVSSIKKVLAGATKRRSPEYVHIKEKHGKLWPGVYQRIKTTKGFNRKTHRTAGRMIQRGRMRGRFASAIIARGLKPIMLEGRTGHKVKPLLDFYGVAHRTFNQRFEPLFWDTLNRFRQS